MKVLSKIFYYWSKMMLIVYASVTFVPYNLLKVFNRIIPSFKYLFTGRGVLSSGEFKVPNYLETQRRPGSETVFTECLRNDTQMSVRMYSNRTDLETCISFKQLGAGASDLKIPLEAMIATKDSNGNMGYINFVGILIPVRKMNKKEWDKQRRLHGDIGTGFPDTQINVKEVAMQDLPGNGKDVINPGSKVLN